MRQAQRNPFDLFGDSHKQCELSLDSETPRPKAPPKQPSFQVVASTKKPEPEKPKKETVIETLYVDSEPANDKRSNQRLGIYYDLTNEEYHTSEGVSKSNLDLVADNPSQLEWSRNAPRDDSKEGALNEGTAIHTLLLEPEKFYEQFITGLDHPRRSDKEKAAWKAFEEDAKAQGKIIVEQQDLKKLHIMRDSVYAHPMGRQVFEAEGYNESSIYWRDERTQELCRIRPDRVIKFGDKPVIVDVKKIASFDRLEKHIEEYRYHLQDAMYSEGYEQHFGVRPEFWFLFVCSSAHAGKYEVEVVQLEKEWKDEGHQLFRELLEKYSYCRKNNKWSFVRTLERPKWRK